MADELRARIRTSVTGMQEVEKLKNSMRQLASVAKPASADIDKLRSAALKLGNASDRTENELRTQISVLRDLRANVSLTGKRYKQLTRDINKAEAALKKSGASGKGAAGRFGQVSKTFGAIGGAGIFGGPEGLAGAAIGSFGGPGGAVVGGIVGAQVGMARKQLGEMGKFQASLKKQRLALELVIADTDKYSKSQEFLAKTSDKLAIPQDVIVRQFTALTASVIGAGKSVEDAQDVFLSIASGIRGTGGTLEDMKAAMIATSQVFSKGKVSAEELRQQLGERLPGAFTLFAASMQKTPQQLDKALEQGKVTLEDFLGFSTHLFKEYGKNAEILATSPAAAGDRLATEFSKFKDNFGGLFANIGALFQDQTTNTLKFFNTNKDIIKKSVTDIVNIFGGISRVFKKIATDIASVLSAVFQKSIGIITKVFNKVASMVNALAKALGEALEAFKKVPGLGDVIGNFQEFKLITVSDETKDQVRDALQPAIDYKNDLKELFKGKENLSVEEVFGTPKFDEFIANAVRAKEAAKKLNDELDSTGKKINKVMDGVNQGIQGYVDGLGDVAKEMKDAVGKALQGLEDQLVNFVTTGKFAFKELARSIIADITRIMIRQRVLKPILSSFGFNPLENAKGNVFAQNGIQKFARGGIVDKPTIFPFKNGTGLMGEAGPEAILPLRRGKGGRLGVESSGGATSVVVNVDASNSDVQGDQDNGRQLGQLIAVAVQSQLIEQSRPGGLLNQS